jgi:hypothetical protein
MPAEWRAELQPRLADYLLAGLSEGDRLADDLARNAAEYLRKTYLQSAGLDALRKITGAPVWVLGAAIERADVALAIAFYKSILLDNALVGPELMATVRRLAKLLRERGDKDPNAQVEARRLVEVYGLEVASDPLPFDRGWLTRRLTATVPEPQEVSAQRRFNIASTKKANFFRFHDPEEDRTICIDVLAPELAAEMAKVAKVSKRQLRQGESAAWTVVEWGVRVGLRLVADRKEVAIEGPDWEQRDLI